MGCPVHSPLDDTTCMGSPESPTLSDSARSPPMVAVSPSERRKSVESRPSSLSALRSLPAASSTVFILSRICCGVSGLPSPPAGPTGPTGPSSPTQSSTSTVPSPLRSPSPS